jgi:phosphate/sulfate permease
MTGTSSRSLVVNCFFQTIILLYLFDNDTSMMVLGSSVIGLLIEYWKLATAYKVTLDVQKLLKGQPFMTFPSETDSTESEDETSAYDKEATVHLLYVVLPLIAGYSAYALYNRAYKSFYSWIVSSLVGFVYAFGFVLMTPQLYINYKLKSVAHMPWKAMVYKSLNTFIDDLFAFIIKMPLLHRLACFRDDIIFFIYLYQRWIYPIDPTRMNEYGQEAPSTAEININPVAIADSKTGEKESSSTLTESVKVRTEESSINHID